jgi:hypothetical protein
VLKWYVLVKKWLKSGRNRRVSSIGVNEYDEDDDDLVYGLGGFVGLLLDDEDRRRRSLVAARFESA